VRCGGVALMGRPRALRLGWPSWRSLSVLPTFGRLRVEVRVSRENVPGPPLLGIWHVPVRRIWRVARLFGPCCPVGGAPCVCNARVCRDFTCPEQWR
jgi:hypothetical protein